MLPGTGHDGAAKLCFVDAHEKNRLVIDIPYQGKDFDRVGIPHVDNARLPVVELIGNLFQFGGEALVTYAMKRNR